jgi:hypothetical protein
MLVVESRGERQALEATLSAVPGVRSVGDVLQLESAPPPLFRLRLEIEQATAAEAVSAALAAAGFALRELRREQTSLEDVFARLTTRDLAQLESTESGATPITEGA